jgi:hypothetical protein
MKSTSSYWWEWTKDKKIIITIVGENEQTKKNKGGRWKTLIVTSENEQGTKKQKQ